jgi:hypothetical protein
MKRLNTRASIFGDDDDKADFIELLSSMFDLETGDDLVDVVNPQLEALLPYYNKLEKYAMEVATKRFGSNIIYNLDTKKQKLFSYTEKEHSYLTYLDGFQETEDEVRIFEVKATTSKKYLELGPKIDGIQTSIFENNNNIMSIKTKIDIPLDKFNSNYQKLFNRYSESGKYAFDLAVERFIIERSLQHSNPYKGKKFKYFLVVLNTDYVFDGNYDKGEMVFNPDKYNNEIVTFIDMTEITRQYQIYIEEINKELLQYISKLSAREVALGTYCERKKQAKCAFLNTCWHKAIADGSILEYMNNHHGFKDEVGETHNTIDLINEGYLAIDSIPVGWLERKNNQIQRECYDKNIEYINIDKIIKGIKSIKYPIYHLDFESFPSPLPRFKGERPYNQSVFQFSLHIEREMGKCDKDKDHLHFLSPDNNDHRLELVEKLIEYIDLSNGGTVLVYNKSFEYTRIKEFSFLFPEHKKALEKINRHIFDLIDLVNTRAEFYKKELGFSEEESKTVNYYNNRLHGSYSIKKVLPIFSDLTYEGMPVGNGTEAIAAYANFNNLESEDLEKLQKDLIEYCKQDTWAMVVVLWGLIKKAGISLIK